MRKFTLLSMLAFLCVHLSLFAQTEQSLYSTNFQNWTVLTGSTTTFVNNLTTNYGEAFTISLTSCDVLPTNGAVTNGSAGAIRFQKVATAVFETSMLASVTKVNFAGYVTGSSRGYTIFKKNCSKLNPDASWVQMATSTSVLQSGTAVSVPINEDSVAIKIISSNTANYYFLTDLEIFGNTTAVVPVFKSSTPANLSVIPTSGTIQLKYSEPISRGTGSITLGSTTIDESNISVSDSVATITYSGLKTDSTYSLTIPAGAFLNGASTPTVTQTTLTFTTPDTKAPDYTFQSDNNTSVVPVSGFISLQFNEAVKAASSVSIGGVSVTPAISGSQNYLVYLNYSGLDYGTDYTVTIPAGAITDLSGNPAPAKTFTITTEGNYKGASLFSVTPNSTDYPATLSGDVTKTITGTDAVTLYNITFGNVSSAQLRSSNGWGFKTDYVVLPKTPIGQVSFKIQCGGGTVPQKYYIQKLGVDNTTWANIDTIMIGTNDVVTFTSAVAQSADSTTIRLYKDGSGFWFYNLTVNNYLDNNAANDDGFNPSIASSIPADNETGVSTTGTAKITFSESIKSATGSFILNGKTLTPNILGKVVSLPYTNLKYSTQYQLIIEAGAVKDYLGNLCAADTITFTTKAKPVVTPSLYDFVVAKDGSGNGTTIQSAFDAVPAGNTAIFRIFVKNGTYNEYPSLADGKTNVSLIGQDRDKVIITGSHYSGQVVNSVTIGTATSQTMEILGDNFYCENITIQNAAGRDIGQAVALKVYADKAVFKNVKLLGYQDTYMSSNVASDRQYFLNSDVHGTVDFIFNDGVGYFDNCSLYIEDRSTANVVCAPATTLSNTYGFVFNECTIDGASSQDGVYYLGRPWKNGPKAVYINTKMNIGPATDLWTTMSALPSLFVEYNSVSRNGNVLSFSPRTDFTFTNNSVTTTDSLTTTRKSTISGTEAAVYRKETVLAGTDSWDATTKTGAPAAVENLTYDGTNTKLSWSAVDGAACYIILSADSVVGFTTSTDYTISGTSFSVIAASEYGALSELRSTTTGIFNSKIKNGFLIATLVNNEVSLINPNDFNKVEIISLNGQRVSSSNSLGTAINVSSLPTGCYLVKGYATNGDIYVDRMIKK